MGPLGTPLPSGVPNTRGRVSAGGVELWEEEGSVAFLWDGALGHSTFCLSCVHCESVCARSPHGQAVVTREGALSAELQPPVRLRAWRPAPRCGCGGGRGVSSVGTAAGTLQDGSLSRAGKQGRGAGWRGGPAPPGARGRGVCPGNNFAHVPLGSPRYESPAV